MVIVPYGASTALNAYSMNSSSTLRKPALMVGDFKVEGHKPEHNSILSNVHNMRRG